MGLYFSHGKRYVRSHVEGHGGGSATRSATRSEMQIRARVIRCDLGLYISEKIV
jgi:hypothetical protein